MQTKFTLTTNQMVKVADVLQLYRAAFKKDQANTAYFTGAKKMLTNLACLNDQQIRSLLTQIQCEVYREEYQAKQEREADYQATVAQFI